MKNSELEQLINDKLNSAAISDFAPNGLQVEGRDTVHKIVTGVTASQALLDEAVRLQADAVIVHHGYFWKNESPVIRGMKRRRLKTLLANDINLYGWHLPLDAHPELGNNAQLGARLGVRGQAAFGEQNLGWLADVDFADAAALAGHVQSVLGRKVTLAGAQERRPIRKLAWCTGGAQGFFESAIAAGADAYITGEISEPQMHLAREMGVSFIAAGHHATERYGAPAVAAHVARECGLEHCFIDIDNPA